MQNVNITGILRSSLFIPIFVNRHYIFFSEFSAIDRYLEASHFTIDPKMDFHLDQKVVIFEIGISFPGIAPISSVSV